MSDKLELAERCEPLSLGYTEPRIECSRARWFEVFRDYARPAAYHAANLASHNWDVWLVDGRVFLFQTRYGGERGHWLNKDGTRQDATAKEQGRLYTRSRNRRSQASGEPRHD